MADPSGVRVYETDRIQILWQPQFCSHSGKCVTQLSEVFRSGERPWIVPDAADPDRIAEQVRKCPSGALHYRRLDGGVEETPDAETTAVVRPRGPLDLRGRVSIKAPDGTVLREDSRVAICRCGQSGNKPFCDGTHRKTDFER